MLRNFKPLTFFILCSFSISFAKVQGQNTEITTQADNLKSSAQKMGNAFVNKDFNEYIKYLHPRIVQGLGGVDKMITGLKGSLKHLEDNGITYVDITVGRPSKIINVNTELQSVVPQTFKLKTRNGNLIGASYIIGVSIDKGKSWHFIETNGKTLDKIKLNFPSLSDALIIPKN